MRAPELRARGGWLNTGGVPLTLAGLRGKFVLLDFWTYCCINCMHVLPDLEWLEERVPGAEARTEQLRTRRPGDDDPPDADPPPGPPVLIAAASPSGIKTRPIPVSDAP